MNKVECVNKYSSEYFRSMFGRKDISDEESRARGLEFLRRYAVEEDADRAAQRTAMRKVFRLNEQQYFDFQTMALSQLLQPGFRHFCYISSPLFCESDFRLMQAIGKSVGDTCFYIVEYEGCEDTPDTAFKLKFPIDISWQEFCSGGCISDTLVYTFHNCYYVFGDSGQWGRWCDYDNGWKDYELFAYTTEDANVKAYWKWFSVSPHEHQKTIETGRVPEVLREGYGRMVDKEKSGALQEEIFAQVKKGHFRRVGRLIKELLPPIWETHTFCTD